jgi:GntR family transcriptional regulator
MLVLIFCYNRSVRWKIDPRSPLPLYAQLEHTIRAAVASGALKPGDQLPTVRQLAVDLRVNANTVARVYAELERAGMVSTQRGRGTFVLQATPPSSPARQRERELRSLVDRTLSEAAALGIPARDLVRHLQSRLEETD